MTEKRGKCWDIWNIERMRDRQEGWKGIMIRKEWDQGSLNQ